MSSMHNYGRIGLVRLFAPVPKLAPTRMLAGHNYIGTEHILLGLLREGEGVAARVLETLGADPAKIRTQVSYPSPFDMCVRSA